MRVECARCHTGRIGYSYVRKPVRLASRVCQTRFPNKCAFDVLLPVTAGDRTEGSRATTENLKIRFYEDRLNALCNDVVRPDNNKPTVVDGIGPLWGFSQIPQRYSRAALDTRCPCFRAARCNIQKTGLPAQFAGTFE